MELIQRVIDIQDEKKLFLVDYLQLNEMIDQAAQTGNTYDLQSLNVKKRKQVEALAILDQRFLEALSHLKVTLVVDDLGEADTQVYPELKVLKTTAGEVLKLMVEAKRSDDTLKTAIDTTFSQLKGSKRPIDLNRMYRYTQEYFKESEE
jgi:hypothetical protein